MANYKVYFAGNYMLVVNATTLKVYEAPKKDSKVIKEDTDVYTLVVGSRQFKNVPFANIQDSNGSAYSDAATFETLYRSNTGDSMDISIDDTRTFENAITVPDVTVSNQTASRIASVDGSKKVVSLSTSTYPSLTELANVKGSIQRVDPEIVAKTNDFTLTLAEAGDIVTFSKSTAVTCTIPLNASVAFAIGTKVKVVNLGVGTLTVAITATGTLLSKSSLVAITTGGTAEMVKIATDTWALTGDLS
jgi:hypothetical protein